MKQKHFKFLVIVMSVALLGISFIQVYWIKTTFDNNDKQFQYSITKALNNTSKIIQEKEKNDFIRKIIDYKDSTGVVPNRKVMQEILYIEKNIKNKDEIVYTSKVFSDTYDLKDFMGENHFIFENLTSERVTKVFEKPTDLDDYKVLNKNKENVSENIIIEDSNPFFEFYYEDVICKHYSINTRLEVTSLKKILEAQLKQNNINTTIEFAVYENNNKTDIATNNFKDKSSKTYEIPLFVNKDLTSNHTLKVYVPKISKVLYSKITPFIILSLFFILIVVTIYYITISKFKKQLEISKIKNNFINNMTHEFKTPISTINLALDAIKNPRVINDETRVLKYAQMIREENKRMHAQIENILQLSKLAKKELDIPKEHININHIINDAVSHISLIIENKKGTIQTDLQAIQTDVFANKNHLTNVLINILDNAVKYSPNQPRIELNTENINQFILIKIRDYGQGIGKQAQKKVFEKFFRENSGDLHNVKGHGLGLAYVKQIIEEHNGDVFVESEKDKGSTFYIKLTNIN